MLSYLPVISCVLYNIQMGRFRGGVGLCAQTSVNCVKKKIIIINVNIIWWLIKKKSPDMLQWKKEKHGAGMKVAPY